MKKEKANIKNKSKEFPFWIISLLLPPIGLILYFIIKKNNKKESSIILKSLIIGLCVYCFGFLIILNKLPEKTVKDWYNDVNNGKTVVTVIGLTTCSHCQEYKPIITSLSKKYKFDLYFFEVDSLKDEENSILMNTLELNDYDEHVPFTFIVKDNKYVSGIVGYSNKDNIVSYLSENGIIEEN